MATMILFLLIGVLLWGVMAFGARMDSGQRVLLGAAIMLGLAGYLVVGSPGLSGAPIVRAEPEGFGDKLEDPRQGMGDRFNQANQWLAMSDGFIRTGRTELAAQTLEKAIEKYPRNVDLWVALGNALTAHSGGIMTPASAMAFDRAAAIDPAHPAPPFFAGLALAQGGDLEGARFIWQQLFDRTPADAPWRADLEQRLKALPPAPAPAAEGAPPPPLSAQPSR